MSVSQGKTQKHYGRNSKNEIEALLVMLDQHTLSTILAHPHGTQVADISHPKTVMAVPFTMSCNWSMNGA